MAKTVLEEKDIYDYKVKINTLRVGTCLKLEPDNARLFFLTDDNVDVNEYTVAFADDVQFDLGRLGVLSGATIVYVTREIFLETYLD